jgi:hypothetical protein
MLLAAIEALATLRDANANAEAILPPREILLGV